MRISHGKFSIIVFLSLCFSVTLFCILHTLGNLFPAMDLLPNAYNFGLRMRREWSERFSRHRALAIPACIKARAWPLSDKKPMGFLSDIVHVHAVMHSGTANQRFPFKSVAGNTFPGSPTCALCILEEAHILQPSSTCQELYIQFKYVYTFVWYESILPRVYPYPSWWLHWQQLFDSNNIMKTSKHTLLTLCGANPPVIGGFL